MNKKSWGSLSVPFAPIARTALGHDGRIFAQLDVSTYERSENKSPMDAWFSIHTTLPELVDAQVLLAGMPTSNAIVYNLMTKIQSKVQLSIAESEIKYVFQNLCWCYDNWLEIAEGTSVGRTMADLDCHSKGKHISLT